MVVVRLLGPVDVVDRSGTTRAPDSTLRRSLLALLALRAGEVLTADWLLEHTWAGTPPESGLRALRFHISRLRKELGDDDMIETRPGGYRLAISAEQVDVLVVEERVRAAKVETDRRLAAEIYAEALAMWRGVPFTDAAPCSVLDDEAARLSELRQIVTENHYQALLDSGAGGELVADLSRATTQHPLRESLWSMLIVAQYRAGRQADALRSYEQMRAMLADSLGLDPSTELQDLQRRVLQHDPTLLYDPSAESENIAVGGRMTRLGLRDNLPTPATPLIDGSDRLGIVYELLSDHRLVTLTGTGGVGKSRLAVELGRSCLDRFEGGVWLVELAPVENSDAVVAALAAALSIRLQQGSTLLESMVDWFRGRELLLIIDNCEHVLDAVREVAQAVLARCPTVKLVTTSREPLGLVGERVYSVTVLDPASEGVALFLDRAAAADSSFVWSDVDHDAITAICQRLDGLPLAIELAAARIRSTAPVDLLTRLDDRFKLLRGTARDWVDHHGTLRATVEWSYQLLTEPERTAFDQLSVFAGGLDLRAAEVVCASDSVDESDVVDLLSNLVDKSMVVAERRASGTRYRLLETLRQFGVERLHVAGHTAGTRGRHLRHYAEVADRADTLFRSSDQVIGAGIFDEEWANLRSAHEWTISTGDLAMAERLIAASRLYAMSQMRLEHGDWVEQTIGLATAERQPSPNTFAQAGYWAWSVEDMSRAWELVERGLELIVDIDDPSAALCLSFADLHEHTQVPDPYRHLEIVAPKLDLDREWWVLIELAHGSSSGPPPQSTHVARLVRAADKVRAPTLMVAATMAQGHRDLRREPPDCAAALEFYTRGVQMARQSGDLASEAECLRAVALATTGLHADTAIDACREALIKLYEIRYWGMIWRLFESIGLSLASTRRIEAASIVTGHLEAHHPPFGYEHSLGFRVRTLEIVRSDAQVEEWMTRGAAMDRFEIVDYALGALERSTRHA